MRSGPETAAFQGLGLKLGEQHPSGFAGIFQPVVADQLTEITRAAKAYYAQAPALGLMATDFQDWVASRPPNRQAEVGPHGFAADPADPDFLRYCLEWRDYDMCGFMAARLSVAAFTLWAAHGEFNGDLPPHGIAGEMSEALSGRAATARTPGFCGRAW